MAAVHDTCNAAGRPCVTWRLHAGVQLLKSVKLDTEQLAWSRNVSGTHMVVRYQDGKVRVGHRASANAYG